MEYDHDYDHDYASDINQAYQDVLGRDADEKGMDIYQRMLNEGTISLEELPTALKSGQEYRDNGGAYIVDPSEAMRGAQGGSKVLGELYRAQWEDWKSRFAPKIDQLAEMASDKTLPGRAAEQALQAVNNRFKGARTALDMNQKRLGLQVSGAQQAAQHRKLALTEAAAMANAANKARTSTQDMQQSIIAGNMGTQALPIGETIN